MVFSILKRKPKTIEPGLERGWQFYARPNTLETVGYVFRIDEDDVRYPVTRLKVKTEKGVEAGVKVSQRMDVKAGVLARFLELIDLDADASIGRARLLEFEINEPIRVMTTEVAMEAALKKFQRGFTGKKGSRYYVICQTRSASSMTFRLSADFVAELGGEGKLSEDLKAGASLKVGRSGVYEIHQAFPERLLVTFQALRLERISAGLAEEGALGLVPATEMLEWREPAGE